MVPYQNLYFRVCRVGRHSITAVIVSMEQMKAAVKSVSLVCLS